METINQNLKHPIDYYKYSLSKKIESLIVEDMLREGTYPLLYGTISINDYLMIRYNGFSLDLRKGKEKIKRNYKIKHEEISDIVIIDLEFTIDINGKTISLLSLSETIDYMLNELYE